MTPAEFAVMWLFRIGAVAFLLWCAVSVYRHKVRRNRRVGLPAHPSFWSQPRRHPGIDAYISKGRFG